MLVILICNPKAQRDMLQRLELFVKVLEEKNIDFLVIDPHTFDETSFIAPVDYCVLRLSSDFLSIKLDAYLRPKSFFDCTSLISRSFVDCLYELDDLKFVKTIEFVSSDLSILKRHVEALGGFPLVLKVNGSSRGVGVMQVDSMNALISQIDFLKENACLDIQLKQFFSHTSQLRVLVAYGKLIGAMEIFSDDSDFRSNVNHTKKQRKRRLVKPRKDILENCLRYAAFRGVDFIGVDVLINGNDYRLIEGNAPCNFLSINSLTKGAVPGLIIDAMLDKYRKHEIRSSVRAAQTI